MLVFVFIQRTPSKHHEPCLALLERVQTQPDDDTTTSARGGDEIKAKVPTFDVCACGYKRIKI